MTEVINGEFTEVKEEAQAEAVVETTEEAKPLVIRAVFVDGKAQDVVLNGVEDSQEGYELVLGQIKAIGNGFLLLGKFFVTPSPVRYFEKG